MDQVAGCGFLAAVKLVTDALGHDERFFRLVPLLAGCAVLPLFFIAAYRFAGRALALIGLMLLAASPSLVRYSSELKPYGTDAAMTAAMMLLFFTVLRTRGTWPLILLGILGLAAPWFSLPAVFVLCGFGLTCLIAALKQRDWRWTTIWISLGLAWCVSFSIEYALTLRSSTQSKYLLTYWSGAFAPLPPKSLADLRWFIGKPAYMFVELFGVRYRYLALALLALGALVAWRKDKLRLCMLISPFPLVLICSALHKYPFSGRLLLFLTPLLAFLMAAGIEAIWMRRQWWIKLAGAVCMVGLLAEPVAEDVQSARAVFHYAPQPGMVAAVALLKDHAQPADAIVVSRESNWTYMFYAYRANLAHPAVFLPEATHLTPTSIPPQPGNQHRLWIVLSTFRADSPDSELQLILPRAREMGREIQRYPFAGIFIVEFSAGLER
jgi:4-amino-4-deoxy-L-arabinose transferase-like glycosyltransferase